MNRGEFIAAFTKESGITKAKAEKIVGIFFNIITDTLVHGGRVELRDLWTLSVKNYKGYTGRNPKTGAPVIIRPKRLPFFKCGKELKEMVDH